MENNGLNEIDKFGFITNLSRTLYIGNLKENIDDDTLFRYFGEFGQIISINIKRVEYVGGRPNIYAFIKYFDSNNVIIAILKMNGVNIEGCRIRLGFGKTYPSKCVWITGINELGENNNLLQIFVTEFGSIENYLIDRINKRALIYFKEFVDSEAAINKMKNRLINGLYLRSDYASIECQKKFAEFFHRPNDNIYLSTPLNNVHIQNTSISNVNRERPAVSHVETDSTSIASKEITSEIILIYSIWVNGIADSVTNEYLESHFSQFGPIQKCLIDRSNKCALLCFQEESHAKYAAFVMNGRYFKNEQIHVHLASKSASDVPNINNDNETIQLKDNMAQSSPDNTRHVDLSGKSTINDETDPINISNPRNNSTNVNNAQHTSQQKYLNTCNTDITKYSSKTHDINNSPITIIVKEYPPERITPPTQYVNSDILSLPLPEFAKNISKELTSTSSRYSLSSNAFGNEDTYTFKVHHDEMINCSLGKTDKQDKKQDQNNSHPPKSNYKMLQSVAEVKKLYLEEVKKLLNEHTHKEFIQSQSSSKFEDPQLNSSLGTLSTSGSSKYSLGPSASVIQSHCNSQSDTQPKNIPQNSKTPLLDSQILPSNPKLLIDPKCASATNGMKSDLNGLFLTKKNIYTASNSMHTPDAINTGFVNPIPKDVDRDKTILEIAYKFRDEYPKDLVSPSNCLTNTSNYNCVEKLDHRQEKEGQKKLQSKQKSLDGFVAKNSIEPVVQPNFVDVEKSTNIDEEKLDNDICKKSNSNVLLSLKTDYQTCGVNIFEFDKLKTNQTENSLKRSVSNPSEYHNDSKRWKTDNKTYKNDSTETSKRHSPLLKPSKNVHNNWKPENKNMSKLDKTQKKPRIRGWLNGYSISDILSNGSKVSSSDNVKN